MPTTKTNFIKEFREAAGLSKEELARRVGTTGQQIGHLEKGRIRLSVDWAKRIANVVECYWADLIDGGPDELTRRERQARALLHDLSPERMDMAVAMLRGLAEHPAPSPTSGPNGNGTGGAPEGGQDAGPLADHRKRGAGAA